MDFKDFAEYTKTTAVYPGAMTGSKEELSYLALGLAGETGEVVDCIKKVVRGLSPGMEAQQKEKALKELGDVTWYWVRLCEALGGKPEDVFFATANKLEDRKRQGALKEHA